MSLPAVKPSPAETPSRGVPLPGAPDEIAYYLTRVQWLERKLSEYKWRLSMAYKRAPVDDSILKRPYQIDISVPCAACGHRTRWVIPNGPAKCQPTCPAPRGMTLGQKAILDELFSDSDDPDNLDDD